jgi:hypothetical protein
MAHFSVASLTQVVLLLIFNCWTKNWQKMGSFNQVSPQSHENWHHDNNQPISGEPSHIENEAE